MFVRVKTTPNSPRKSIQICETYRVGDTVKQKILRYIGIAQDEREEQKLKDLAHETMAIMIQENLEKQNQLALFKHSKNEVLDGVKNKKGRPKKKDLKEILPPSQVSLDDIVEEKRIVEGVHDVCGCMYDHLYASLFKEKKLHQILKDLVLARLVEPASKRQTQHQLDNQFDKIHSLDSIYRMMDKLETKIDDVKKLTFDKTQALFPGKIDLLFFDVTTLYFESTTIDTLRNFGYSKDHRFNTTQLVLALATNQDGLPIGYELFSGNSAEVTTLLKAIENWKKILKIGSICFVGDRAMFTKKNIQLLKEHNHSYIIAAKLKKLPQTLQSQLFQESQYRPTSFNNTFGWVGEFEYEGSRLIVSYKSQRARKDQKEREQILNKIQKVMGKKGNPHKFITNAGVKHFVTKDKNATISIDQDKVEYAQNFDGLHGVITNIKDQDAESIIARYSRLWVIEESFRINKHTLQMRPIFHWKENRIKAHIALCYMTFSLLRHMQYRINLTQKISINTILDELKNVQASIHVHKKTKDKYRIPGYFSHNARKIYKAFNLERSLDATIYQP